MPTPLTALLATDEHRAQANAVFQLIADRNDPLAPLRDQGQHRVANYLDTQE